MGFITGMLGKSLFTEDSYRGAFGTFKGNKLELGYSTFVIKPKMNRLGKEDIDPTVVGIINDKLKLNYDAKWEEMGGISSIIPGMPFVGAGNIANRFGNMAGAADFGAVYASKLMYHKSGFLEITPTFKVVDWKGNGDPLKAAFFLASYCVPILADKSLKDAFLEFISYLQTLDTSDEQILNKTIRTFFNAYRLGEAAVNFGIKNIDEFVNNKLGEYGSTISQGASTFAQRIGEELEDDYLTFRAAPVPVEIWIGQYFHHDDMVVKNVSIEFSKEMTKQGPLFVDISVSLSSRKIMGDPKYLGFSTKVLDGGNRLIDVDANNFVAGR